jgi:anaerobic magnesium-protoporphyrin IX monomethyl ester cyclase
MKVLLTNLPWRRGSRWGVRAGSRWPHIKDSRENTYQPFPFFLAYSAALLAYNDYQVHFIDALAEKITEASFLNRVRALSPHLVVAETSTPSLASDLRLLKKIPRNIPIALAGPEISIRRNDFLQYQNRIDYVLHGEYEHTLLALLNEIEGTKDFSGIPGLSFRSNGSSGTGPPPQLIQDLDALPWPLRHGLPMKAYQDTPGEIPTPSVQMLSSRGCPFECGFCAWPQIMYGGSNYRTRSIRDILDEMEYCVKDLGFQSIYFDDDTFNVSKRRTLKFGQELKRRQTKGMIQVPWAMMARADLMTEEILNTLRDAGLESIKYGVESADQELLDAIGKRMNFKQNDKMIRLTQSLGIKTHLTFILGLPGENQKTLQKTIDYAIEVSPHTLQFSIATPFPGTWYYEELKEAGLITTFKGSEFDGNHGSVFETTYLSSDQLQTARRIAYKKWRKHLWLREAQADKSRSSLWPTRDQIKRTIRGEGIFEIFRTAFHYMKFMADQKIILNRPTSYHSTLRTLTKVKYCIKYEGIGSTLGKVYRHLHPGRKIREYKNVMGVIDKERAFKGPDVVQIDPTNNCNNNCVGCWCHSDLLKSKKYSGSKKKLTLPGDFLRGLVDELAALGTTTLYVAGGGEPFMHPRLLDFIEYAKKEHGMICCINTNFTLISDRMVERLCNIGVDSLTVSVWAGTAKTYVATHPNKNEKTFYRIKDRLLSLNTQKPKGVAYTKVYHVINNLNYFELEAMLDFAIETKSNSVEYTVTDTVGGYTDCLLLNSTQLEECHRQCRLIEKRANNNNMYAKDCQILNWDLFKRRLNDPNACLAEYDGALVNALPCYVGWTYARVNPDGNVNSCLKSHKFPVGNLFESSFSDIWNGSKQAEFRRHALVRDKAQDRFFKIMGNDSSCDVGCYKTCDNIADNQRMHAVMQRLSRVEKSILERIIQLSHRRGG